MIAGRMKARSLLTGMYCNRLITSPYSNCHLILLQYPIVAVFHYAFVSLTLSRPSALSEFAPNINHKSSIY